MADRQDIDALIVGALYGELDDADRARLEAHLSSHPEDRAALEALERTRATVRRGIATMPEPEPNPAISTLLLREAGRLAPAAGRAASAAEPAQEEGLWGRFLRWARPVAMHPAFAGAAALVLVAGTATALWVQGRGEVAEPEAPRAAERAQPSTPPADDPAPPPPALMPGTEGDYRVDLDQAGEGKLADDTGGDKSAAEIAGNERETVAKGSSRDGRGRATEDRKRKVRPEAAGYVDVSPKKDPLAIKDLPDQAEKIAVAEAEVEDDAATSRGARVAKQGQASGGAGAPAPEPKPVDPALKEWAQGAHARLVKLVADGKCPEAGRLGAEIKDKAPEYYAANVANDRAIRACKSYIEGQAKKKAEKNYKSRSQSNTFDESADSTK